MKRFLLTFILLLGVLAARTENIVSVSSVSGHPQDELTVQLSLVHTDAAVAFQVEIPLGSQLTYVPGSVALNPDRITDHQVSAAVVNGSLRIYVFSLSLTPFVGNEGNLLSFNLKLKNEPGNYALELNQAKLSNASGNALSVTTNNGMVTILAPKLQINTASINYGHVPIRSEYTQNARVTNVGNEPLTITGISFSDPVFGCPGFAETTLQPNGSASFAFLFSPEEKGAVIATATIASNSISGIGAVSLVADPFAVNEIHISNTTGYCDSIVDLPISMNNMESIIGFQIEANLNPALEFVDFTLSDRKSDHVATAVVSGAILRLMAYSPTGVAFAGDDGVIGTVRLRLHGLYGNYYLNPSKAVLADANGEDVLSQKYQGYVTVRSPRIAGNASVDFGSTAVNETVTREYVIRNNGNAPMRIDKIVFDQSDFSVSEAFPMTIGQYSNTTIHVSYDREQKGDFTALMKIYSNDPQDGLKNVTLIGNRYEPNSLGLTADAFSLGNDEVAIALTMDNYSGVVALQANFSYPYRDYNVQPSDFQLTDRFADHSLYAMPINDSTYRVLVLSMQNDGVEGNDGVVLNVTLHPIGTPSEEEYAVSVTDVVLSGVEGANIFTGSDATATFTLAITQEAQLAHGWNWWSTYIEMGGVDGLTMLENQLGSNGLVIKSQNDFTTNYYETIGYDYWYGGLEQLTNESGYMINTSSPTNLGMVGRPAKLAEHPIAIHPNWNWIGYPVNREQLLVTAMEGFQPENNDVMKDQAGFATYYAGYGWYPQDFVVTPGKGYLYNSNALSDKLLTYSVSRDCFSAEVQSMDYHWTTDIHRYADNISVITVVDVEGEEVSDNVEVAAFVNGECRGSAILRYFEPTGRYYALLSVSGNDGDLINFAMSDLNSENYLVFRKNEVVGTLDSPYNISFGSIEKDINQAVIYPNPVDCNQDFIIMTGNGEKIVDVMVYDMLGNVVVNNAVRTNKTICRIHGRGAYWVKAVGESGNTYQNKLIVK